MESRIRRMIQRGYKTSRDEAALQSGTNQYGYALPMLAHPITRVTPAYTKRMWSQPKFDGHRALTVHDRQHVMYSRRGTPITALEHVMRTIRDYVPPDVALDGELYLHGVPLQTIASWIKRCQPDSARLEYIVYDVVMDAPYSERFEVVKDVVRGLHNLNPQINAAYTREIDDVSLAFEDFHRFRGLRYEGSMLRLDGEPYRAGVRSSGLLKIKDREEEEFPILGVTEVKNGLANVVLDAKNGRTFETLAPGTHEEKRRYLVDETIWKDREMTCQFAYKTNEGIPFHCIAIRVREDI